MSFGRTYQEVYSIKTIDELKKHLSNYFTQEYIKEIQPIIEENLVEYEDKLYLVRSGRGYGNETVDFESIQIKTTPQINVTLDILLFGEKDKTIDVEVIKEEGTYKINSIR